MGTARKGKARAALITLALLLTAAFAVKGDCGEKIVIFFFWGKGCPHCEREKAFLAGLEQKHPDIEIRSYEVWYHIENAGLFARLAASHGRKPEGVPAIFVGDFEPVVGYLSEEVTGKAIEEEIAHCLAHGCRSPDARLERAPASEEAGKETSRREQEDITATDKRREEVPTRRIPSGPAVDKRSEREAEVPVTVPSAGKGAEIARDREGALILPLFGRINTGTISLPLLTVIIAGMDGFNPCAFFVLFLLLSILIYARSRKVMLLVGGAFVFFSGFIYFLFMSAWLNIFLLFGQLKAITATAGVIALGVGIINIKDFFYFKKGVSLVIPDRVKPRLFERVRGLMRKTSLTSMMAGTLILAAAANTYELLCTAGFPMVYTRALTLHNLSSVQYYLYLVLYNSIYIIPLSAIVIVFVATLGARKFTEWQGQVLKLISGTMMLSLGGVLLLNPSLLNHVAVSAALLVLSLVLSSIIIVASRKKGVRGADGPAARHRDG